MFEEIRKAVPGYDVQPAGLLTGGAEPTRVHVARNGHAPYDVPAGLIRSAQDTLFTSGTLGRILHDDGFICRRPTLSRDRLPSPKR